MKVDSLKCPGCGADVQPEENKEFAICSYCGTKVALTNENENISRHIDDADVKRAETEQIMKIKEMEQEERKTEERRKSKKLRLKIALVSFVIALVLFIVTTSFSVQDLGKAGAWLALIMVISFIVSIVTFIAGITKKV